MHWFNPDQFCIAIGLDHVSKVNREHGWNIGDRMLKESGRGLRRFLQEGDELYRLDGANFVLTGQMDSNAARQRATEMRRTLGTANIKVDDMSLPLASSLGVVTVERRVGESDTEVVDAVYDALLATLYRAKEKGATRRKFTIPHVSSETPNTARAVFEGRTTPPHASGA